MDIKDKLNKKLEECNNELNLLVNDKSMKDLCFISCGCKNKATERKLTSYRNKIGVLGNKINALKLAIRIADGEYFTHNDLMFLYTDFLQLRNPEIYYDICGECLTVKSIANLFNTIIKLFIPIGKKQLINMGINYKTFNNQMHIDLN